MTNWRERLKEIVSRPDRRTKVDSLETARSRVAEWIEGTVLPALRDIADELEGHGREAEIDRGEHWAAIKIFHGDEEEFSYVVRGRIYHKMAFAFPEMGTKKDEPRFYRAEIELPSGTHGRDVGHLTRDRIIEDFLESYRKWMGW